MKVAHIIFLFFLAVPFVEIYLLLQLGGVVGVFPTILLVVFTAVLGAVLLRQQGFTTWQRLQASLARAEVPAYEIIEGPILLIGGALLLTPGFVTDAFGFACLIPLVRRKLTRYLLTRPWFRMQATSPFQHSSQQHDHKPGHIIEGEFTKEE